MAEFGDERHDDSWSSRLRTIEKVLQAVKTVDATVVAKMAEVLGSKLDDGDILQLKRLLRPQEPKQPKPNPFASGPRIRREMETESRPTSLVKAMIGEVRDDADASRPAGGSTA